MTSDSNKIEKLKRQFNSKPYATIIVCPFCSKVDINPNTHFDKCNPQNEANRQESENNAWK